MRRQPHSLYSVVCVINSWVLRDASRMDRILRVTKRKRESFIRSRVCELPIRDLAKKHFPIPFPSFPCLEIENGQKAASYRNPKRKRGKKYVTTIPSPEPGNPTVCRPWLPVVTTAQCVCEPLPCTCLFGPRYEVSNASISDRSLAQCAKSVVCLHFMA